MDETYVPLAISASVNLVIIIVVVVLALVGLYFLLTGRRP